jgi:membrane protease subunit (stomatin/prohibitin family)
MGFFSKQFIDVIEWQEEAGQLAWRVPMEDNEIQNGAQLTVREGQGAAFLDQGKLADMYPAGLHTLDTENMPILTNLKNWDKAFKSPFKSDVIFFSFREQTGLKWGTAQPITVRDPEFGALRIRAFGTYAIRIKDVTKFFNNLLGSTSDMHISDLEGQLRSTISTCLAATLGSGQIPFLDLAANQILLSETLEKAVDSALDQWGLDATKLFVESLSLPAEVQEKLDKSSSMKVLGDLDKYAKFQAAEAMETAAEQSGGVAGIGAGAAAGMAIGQAMATGIGAAAPAPAPAASAAPAEDPLVTLEKLHKLMVAGVLSEEEFAAKKTELLSRIA